MKQYITTFAHARRILVASAVLGGGAVLVACGGAADTSGDETTVGGMQQTVRIDGSKFLPGNLQLPVGATVTFENLDAVPHDATANDGSWETETLGDGESGTVAFPEVGEWRYICTIHPGMKARITIIEEAPAQGTATADGE